MKALSVQEAQLTLLFTLNGPVEDLEGYLKLTFTIFLVEPSKNVGTSLSLPVNCNSRLHRNALKMPPVFPVLSSLCLSLCFSLYVAAVFVAKKNKNKNRVGSPLSHSGCFVSDSSLFGTDVIRVRLKCIVGE